MGVAFAFVSRQSGSGTLMNLVGHRDCFFMVLDDRKKDSKHREKTVSVDARLATAARRLAVATLLLASHHRLKRQGREILIPDYLKL